MSDVPEQVAVRMAKLARLKEEGRDPFRHTRFERTHWASEIVERFATDLGEWPYLVVTGGSAAIISKLADFVDAVVPDLCLMGIALAYRRAAGQE